MTYQLTRRVVLGIYAVLVIVPLVVVIFGSLKTSQELFASPFAPPTDWQATTTARSSASPGSVSRSATASSSPAARCRSRSSSPAWRPTGSPASPAGRAACSSGSSSSAWRFPAQANMIPQYVQFETFGLTDSLLGLILIKSS